MAIAASAIDITLPMCPLLLVLLTILIRTQAGFPAAAATSATVLTPALFFLRLPYIVTLAEFAIPEQTSVIAIISAPSLLLIMPVELSAT